MVRQGQLTEQNEFIEKAIHFYVEHLAAENSSRFLPSALVAVLRSTVQGCENRIAHLLFKLTVEISMMMHVLAAGLEIDASQLDALRWQCVQEVKKTNGSITFKKMIPVRAANFTRVDRTAAGHQVAVTYLYQLRV